MNDLNDLLCAVRVAIELLPEYESKDWDSQPDNIRCDIDRARIQLKAAIQKRYPGCISVDSRLPDKGGRYLAYYPNIYGWEIDTFDGEIWGTEGDGYKVTHWMPLPDEPSAA